MIFFSQMTINDIMQWCLCCGPLLLGKIYFRWFLLNNIITIHENRNNNNDNNNNN